MKLKFADLLNAIPKATIGSKLQPTTQGTSIAVPTTGQLRFVEPDFTTESGLSDGAQVILISAPAAVGKSSLATELASRTGNLLWDLSRFNVGSGFFSGLLIDSFGASGYELVRNAIREGKAALILDAADEALVRAGSQSFEAALANLIPLLGDDVSAGPAVVLLGRPDTIASARTFLQDQGVKVENASVAFFTEPQAREFVEVKAAGPKYKVVGELEGFLTSFFAEVQAALGATDWEGSDSFLGYAPVLDALATFYRREENPLRRLNELRRRESNAHVWDLLIEIIRDVLQRETEKFSYSFGGENERKAQYGRDCYGPDVQLAMLLSDSIDSYAIDIPDDEDIDQAWLEEIESQIRNQYRVHPFLASNFEDEANPLLRFANVAFRDYALAASFIQIDDHRVAHMASYWTDALVVPSPMLSRFVFSEALRTESLPPEALTMIVDSHSAGFQDNVRLDIDVSVDGESDSAAARAEITLTEGTKLLESIATFLPPSGPLRLARSAARVSIIAPETTVVAGSGSQDFLIGPGTVISCGEFDSEATEVRLRANGSANIIRAEQITGSTRRIAAVTNRDLQLEVPHAAFPWQAYHARAADDTSISASSLYWAGMAFRRNIKWFARESMIAGSLNYPVAAMDMILRKSRADAEWHSFCTEKGYLTRQGAVYVLQLPGFSAPTVLANDIDDQKYRAFLQDFLTRR